MFLFYCHQLADRKILEMKYWRHGVYVFYSEHAFVLLENNDPFYGVKITVPPSKNGAK